MLSPQNPEFARDLGFESPDEKQALHDSTVMIGGVGGAGFPLGLNLAREGVGHFIVAEPDTIGRTNFNRHPGAFRSTEGAYKADVFATMVNDINPDIQVDVYTDGVTPDNVRELVSLADLVFDGIDFNRPWDSVNLHRTSRELGKVVMTGLEVARSAIVTSFHPTKGPTFEEVNGYSPNDTLEEIEDKVTRDGSVDMSKSLPYIPVTSTDISVMEAVMKGAPLPSNAIGVELFGALATDEALRHLTSGVPNDNASRLVRALRSVMGNQTVGNNRMAPTWAPNYRVIDLDRNIATRVRPSKARFTAQAVTLAARSKLGLNPAVNYDHEIPAESQD